MLGIKVKKTDYGALITFPFWVPIKAREKCLDDLKRDYEVRHNHTMTIVYGVRMAKLEYK